MSWTPEKEERLEALNRLAENMAHERRMTLIEAQERLSLSCQQLGDTVARDFLSLLGSAQLAISRIRHRRS